MSEKIRFRLAWTLAPLLLAGLIFANVAQGSVSLSLAQVLSALGIVPGDVPPMIKSIVLELRLPRTLLGLLAGLAWRWSAHCCKPQPATIWPIPFCLASPLAPPPAWCW
jgi:ABC-type Fe3+-siderophore transport system permease subunit